LLGRPTVRGGDREIVFTPLEELLFVHLALRPGAWVSREQMANAVWEDAVAKSGAEPPAMDIRNPKNRLRSKLGALADELFEYDGSARMRLRDSVAGAVDAHIVKTEIELARRAIGDRDWRQARAAAQQVDNVICAELAAGRTEQWIEAEREDFRAIKVEALQYFAQAELNLGEESNPHAAREVARRLVRHSDANVDWLYLLMVAEFRCGSAEDAQRVHLDFVAAGGTPSRKMEAFFQALAEGTDPRVAEAGHLELVLNPHCRAAAASAVRPDSADRPSGSAERRRMPPRARTAALVAGFVVALGAGAMAARETFISPGHDAVALKAFEDRARPSAPVAPEQLARRALDAFVNGRWVTFESLLAPDVTFVQSSSAERHPTYIGSKNVVARCKVLRGAFSRMSYDLYDPVQEGGKVTYRLTWRGFQTKPLPPSHRWLNGKGRGRVKFDAQIESRIEGQTITNITHTRFASSDGLG